MSNNRRANTAQAFKEFEALSFLEREDYMAEMAVAQRVKFAYDFDIYKQQNRDVLEAWGSESDVCALSACSTPTDKGRLCSKHEKQMERDGRVLDTAPLHRWSDGRALGKCLRCGLIVTATGSRSSGGCQFTCIEPWECDEDDGVFVVSEIPECV